MRLIELARSTTLRWALAVAGAFTMCTLLLFAFVYLQTAVYLTRRIDNTIVGDAGAIAGEPPHHLQESIDERLQQDPRRIKLTALFDSEGRRLSGNIQVFPSELPLDGTAHQATIVRVDSRGRETQVVRAVARRLPGGDVLVLGRNADEVGEMGEIVMRALILGVVPTLGLGLGIGIVLSIRAQRKIEQVNLRVGRIMAGNIQERLPSRGRGDSFDKLTLIVNGMLDSIEGLVREIAGVGDDIAHDLRTPLTRVRVLLERGRDNAKTLQDLQAVSDRAIAGLDKALAIITALLRIAEIEHGRRFAGFGDVSLAALLHEVGELYEPIAEDKKIDLRVMAENAYPTRGDKDLLFEAMANLVDNAVKFTPPGGRIELSLLQRSGESIVRIADTGPGISAKERGMVIKRFYRSDRSRRTPGTGLGLSLVAAIARLHGFRLSIEDGPGCIVEMACPSFHDPNAPLPAKGLAMMQ
jgi:signal transduction histidine kinase